MYKNKWQQDRDEERLWSVVTEPKFGIGQRAFLIRVGNSNVMWDLIAYLDNDTIEKINSFGGLQAIVISHPHFYTTYIEWARTFKCPVYVSADDADWLERMDVQDVERKLIREDTVKCNEGIIAIKAGGHFDGSLLLHWENRLFVADTLVTVPVNTPTS